MVVNRKIGFHLKTVGLIFVVSSQNRRESLGLESDAATRKEPAQEHKPITVKKQKTVGDSGFGQTKCTTNRNGKKGEKVP